MMLLTGLTAGGGLALIHLGGLWLTVNRITHRSGVSPLAAVSLLLRLALVGFGLAALASQGPPMLLAGVIGLVCTRIALLSWLGRKRQNA